MRRFLPLLGVSLLFLFITAVFLNPIFRGRILLPTDLLVKAYGPWSESYGGKVVVKNPYMQDSIVQMYPWKHLVFESVVKKIVPFWNPYQFLGMPFMASAKPMVFYPFSLFAFLGAVSAWHILLFSQLILSLVFTYMLSREFGFARILSVFISLVYAFNSLMITTLEFGSEGHVLLWYPVFFLCAKRYIDGRKRRYVSVLALAIALSILAGQLQYFGYGLIILLAFILYYGHSRRASLFSYAILGKAILLGVGICAIQLIPSIELFSSSYRNSGGAQQLFTHGLREIFHLVLFISPDIFGTPQNGNITYFFKDSYGYFGLIPFIFCVYALIYVKNDVIASFFKRVFLLGILLSLTGIGQFVSYLHIPLLSSGSADRVMAVVLFAGSILSGFGLKEYIDSGKSRRNYVFIIVTVFTFAALFLELYLLQTKLSYVFVSYTSLFFPAGIFGICILMLSIFNYIKHTHITKQIFITAICILTFAELLRFGYRFLTFSPKELFYPNMSVTEFIREQTKNDLSRTFGLTDPEIATLLHIYTVETYNPLYPVRTAKFLQAFAGKGDKELPVNKYLPTPSESLKDMFDFLGVGYFVVPNGGNPSNRYLNSTKYELEFQPIYHDEYYTVYKTPSVYPRFGIYYHSIKENNEEKALSIFEHRSIDFRSTLLLESDVKLSGEVGTSSSVLTYSDLNTQKFKVTTSIPGIFYISDTYYPGWKVRVDGKMATLLRANYNFRAVVVPKGTSTVEFWYTPSNFILSVWVTIGSFLSLIVVSLWPGKRDRKT